MVEERKMNKENTEKLYNDFPELYKQRFLPMTQSCLCFGIETGNGWFDLIYDLSKKLTELNIGIEAVQVKEKFGGLRFYTNFYSEQSNKLIEEAENKSYKICEICGNPGEPNDNGWISTLCEKCRKE